MSELGRVRGAAPGPTLVLVAGIHGNEPAGLGVCERLLERLRAKPPAHGEVVAFAGNPPAIAAGRRYLERDLNRQWTPLGFDIARAAGDPEAKALLDLAAGIDEAIRRARGPVYALDLHTTSADGVPFSLVGPSAAQRAFAAQLSLVGVAGISDRIPGTLADDLGSRGLVALAIEGGQHASPGAVENLEAVVVLALGAAGFVSAAELPDFERARQRLSSERGSLPPLIESVWRHEVRPAFKMEPGFINIQRTPVGTLLAREGDAEIRAPFDGYVLLPLYQALGDDGFFYGRG